MIFLYGLFIPSTMISFQPQTASRPWTRLSMGVLLSIAIAGIAPRAYGLEITPETNEPVQQDSSSTDALNASQPTRFSLLDAADQFLKTGRTTEATLLYQQAKQTDTRHTTARTLPVPTFEVENGPVKVYWREGTAGLEQNLESKIIVPLTLLTQEYPEFIPGHLKLAEGHNRFNRPEEALMVLERGASIYPNVLELQDALIQQQVSLYRWLPAAITARQFATLNPEHERAADFLAQSEIYQKKFRATLRENITSNTIGSIFTGAISVGLTGNPFGAISPIQNAIALLRGEDSVGNSAAKSFRKKLPMVEDEAINGYVNRIGDRLVKVAGRPMNYEFFVVNDDRLNAFALPGGKVFVHSGAILNTRSEAELAGLLSHELSHAILSHSFQTYTQSNATGSFTQVIPFSGLFSKVAVTKYSRGLERQADLLGTRILANAGYAADGLENLTASLLEGESLQKDKSSWLSRHPDSEERLQYLAELIDRNGYNRFAYEGVREHAQVQNLVKAELAKREEQEETEKTKSARQTTESSAIAER